MPQRIVLLAALLWLGFVSVAVGRTWTDSTGNYRVEADLIAFNNTTVVLQREDRQLTAVPIAKLSNADRAFLESRDTVDRMRRATDAMQTWTMASGLKVVGRVVDYAKKDITIQQRRGKTYVNDRLFNNLPEVYQKMLPKIVAHFEKTRIEDKRGFDSWVMKLRGEPRTFTCEGVLLELENGDEYGVPFFFFSEGDLAVLRPGWQRWLAGAKDRAKQEQETFLLQSQAQAYQRDRAANQQIAMMQLEMQGHPAGLFDLWEVRLFPAGGTAGAPRAVVVPARDSRNAAAEAVRRNPGFMAGPASRVSRRY